MAEQVPGLLLPFVFLFGYVLGILMERRGDG